MFRTRFGVRCKIRRKQIVSSMTALMNRAKVDIALKRLIPLLDTFSVLMLKLLLLKSAFRAFFSQKLASHLIKTEKNPYG